MLTRRTLDRTAPWADVHGICLGGHDLTLADWANLNLGGADLSNTVMKGAQLSGVVTGTAKFVGASLIYSSWQGTSAYGADLTHADLTGALVRDTNFSNAHLVGARLEDLNRPDTKQPTASISSTYADASNLVGEPRLGAGANFSGADLTDAKLFFADLAGATFVDAILTAPTSSRQTWREPGSLTNNPAILGSRPTSTHSPVPGLPTAR